MPDLAIRVGHLGKRYQIGEREPYRSARELLSRRCAALCRRLAGSPDGERRRAAPEHLWALRDVSFEVKRGDVVGIVGKNGAGKSTLLKILSRITGPTEGRAEMHGRIGSLLEVGTGFHPELTGRENIFLNGAILGMKRAEMLRKFDEIVAFSEVERFIDTPVKHYSSGMFVRLAFAVAAHLEPEILLVDEVLAVGDVAFQRKCLGKMEDVGRQGRTVLFVSHNMAAVNRLCPHAIWLSDGRIESMGAADHVVAAYLSAGGATEGHGGERRWEDLQAAPGNGQVRLWAVRIRGAEGAVTSAVDVRAPFYVEIEYEVLEPLSGMQIGFWVLSGDGVIVFVAGDNEDAQWLGRVRERGRYTSRCKVPGRLLNSGLYTLAIAADKRNAEILFVQEDALRFRVEQTQLPAHSCARPAGVICPFLEWRVSQVA